MTTPFILGREEWLALPELALPAVKARVDTGARTSALHASGIVPFGDASAPHVRFNVHPLPGRPEIVIPCMAPVIGRRVVTSSNGDRELRFIIRTLARMGERQWSIEISLTNREHMSYRMLLGRQALQDDMLVQPSASFRQPRLGARAYRGMSGAVEEPASSRQLTITLITRRPDNASNRELAEAAQARGHRVVVLDRTRVSLFIDAAAPALLLDGAALGPVDAVVARSATRLGPFSLAVLRHLELQGALALNSAAALRQLADPLAVRQQLAGALLPVPALAASPNERAEGHSDRANLADARTLLPGTLIRRAIIVAGEAVVTLERPWSDPGGLAEETPWTAATALSKMTVEIVEAAARVLGLGLAAIDVAELPTGPLLLDISPAPALAMAGRLAGLSIAERIVKAIEDALSRGARA